MLDHTKDINKYIKEALSDEIQTCKLTKKAIIRYQNDLKNKKFIFDVNEANRVINFVSCLKHVKGKYANQEIKLEAWQKFIIWNLYGFKLKSGLRKYKVGYIEVARKNGKSTLLAGLALYHLIADKEQGAEIYSAATTRDQACLVHDIATAMVKKDKNLSNHIATYKHNLHITKTFSKFEPLSSDYDTMDGKNPSYACVDEYHQHKTNGIYMALRSGMGARTQPMLQIITTAGFNKMSPCYQERDYVVGILDGYFEDDSYFGIIYTLDEDDDWQDEKLWIKSNPNLSVSVNKKDLHDQKIQALENPVHRNSFLTKNLNIWTQSDTIWIQLEKYDMLDETFDESKLRNKICYGGLDLSTVNDITAFSLCFYDDITDKYILKHWFFIPKNNMLERERKDKIPYRQWVDQGYVIATDGDIIDYTVIEAKIIELSKIYRIKEIAYDRYNATDLTLRLADIGLTMVDFGQNIKNMSPAAKNYEQKLYNGQIINGKNPVMRWMVSCCSIKQDENGNIKPVKPQDRNKESKRIDGVITSIMSLDRYTRNQFDGKSIYEGRGIIVL